MPYRPFLCHKREDATELQELKRELCLRGAGGWQDVDDLRLGQRVDASLRRAIGRETGGFVWYGTRASLSSRTICRLEIPTALRRARRGDGYPFVPVFVDLSPTRDEDDLRRAFGRRRARAVNDLNGVVRDHGENLAALAARTARRYVRDLVRDHGDRELRVAITGGREPTIDHDLVLDWRALLDQDGRLVDQTVLPGLIETLADIRVAAQSVSAMPCLLVETHLRLPLAVLVGWEWNRVRPVRLTAVQRSLDGGMLVDDAGPARRSWPAVREFSLAGDGPHVVAVSVGKDLGDAVGRYADGCGARAATHLHVDGKLDPEGVRGLSGWVIEHLATLNGRGVAKHLLLLGPSSLAVCIGAAANGTGRTSVPFWDGDKGYGPTIVIG